MSIDDSDGVLDVTWLDKVEMPIGVVVHRSDIVTFFHEINPYLFIKRMVGNCIEVWRAGKDGRPFFFDLVDYGDSEWWGSIPNFAEVYVKSIRPFEEVIAEQMRLEEEKERERRKKNDSGN